MRSGKYLALYAQFAKKQKNINVIENNLDILFRKLCLYAKKSSIRMEIINDLI